MDKIEKAKEYVRMVIEGYSDNLILLGKQGTGKSFLVKEVVKDTSHTLVTSSISSLELYRVLYNNSDKRNLLIFDDIDGLFESDKSFSLMLSALGDKKCMWVSTTTLLGTVPPQFTFDGRIIVITNQLSLGSRLRENAIKSRCLFFDLDLNHEEIISFMKEIATKPSTDLTVKERLQIVEFIEQNTDDSTKELSLRTQQRIEEMYRYDRQNWKELAWPLLTKDDSISVLLKCLEDAESVDAAQRLFTTLTGLSRATFYRLKNKLSLKVSRDMTQRYKGKNIDGEL